MSINLPLSVLRDRRLSPSVFLILVCTMAHPDEALYPKMLAEEAAISEKTVRKCLETLVGLGYLNRESRFGGYRANTGTEEITEREEESSKRTVKSSTPGQAREKDEKETERERSKEKDKEREEREFIITCEPLESSVSQEEERSILKDNLKDIDTDAEQVEPDRKEIRSREIREVIDYLNAKTGRRYSPKCKQTREHINARLEEDHTVDDFKAVIDLKVKEWKGTKMEKYLRPETLFCSKFDRYVNEAPAVAAESENAETDALWNAMWEAAHT